MRDFGYEYDRKHVLDTLLEDIDDLARNEPRPDFIFFTGDLAFGNLPEESIDTQFSSGFKFLDQIRTKWKPEIRKENTFLVPGNHDVHRDFVTPAVTQFLDSYTDPKKLALLMRKSDRQWDQVIERLRSYREALAQNQYGHLLQNPNSFIYSQIRSVSECEVQVCGLNTAWSSTRDGEKGKLWFCGKWQVGEVTKQARPKISICLMHHPTSWLREEEDIPILDRVLETTFTFLLHGHEHKEWVFPSSPIDHVRIAASASYSGEDADNGYNLTSFDATKGETIVRLRRYDKNGRKWIQNIVARKTDNEGKWYIPGPNAQPQGQGGTRPIAVTLAAAENKYSDVFLAVPMAVLNSKEFKQQRKEVKKVIYTLRRSWGRVYCPAEHIPDVDKWDPPDIAMSTGLKAISNCRLFVMIYSANRPSSILVEAGYALALGTPSLYFVKDDLELPFLLRAAHAAASDVKVYKFRHYSDIVNILKKYRAVLVSLMRPSAPVSPQPTFTKGASV